MSREEKLQDLLHSEAAETATRSEMKVMIYQLFRSFVETIGYFVSSLDPSLMMVGGNKLCFNIITKHYLLARFIITRISVDQVINWSPRHGDDGVGGDGEKILFCRFIV